MSALVVIIVGLILIGVLVYGEGLLPIDPTLVRFIQAATVILGALLIAQRVGVI